MSRRGRSGRVEGGERTKRRSVKMNQRADMGVKHHELKRGEKQKRVERK